ncbi:hypothetical protein EJB05_02223, partial [Eragrostis curvula]
MEKLEALLSASIRKETITITQPNKAASVRRHTCCRLVSQIQFARCRFGSVWESEDQRNADFRPLRSGKAAYGSQSRTRKIGAADDHVHEHGRRRGDAAVDEERVDLGRLDAAPGEQVVDGGEDDQLGLVAGGPNTCCPGAGSGTQVSSLRPERSSGRRRPRSGGGGK